MLSFVKDNLEGNGLLALSAYRQISKVRCCVGAENCPNVEAIARKESNGNASNEQMLIGYSKVCVKPAYEIFKLSLILAQGISFWLLKQLLLGK